MKNLNIYATVLILIFIGCDDVDSVLKYQACCGAEPVEFVQDNYYIYVPNCFTPNGDGINDIFWPSFSSNIESVKSYEIYSIENGLSVRIFFTTNFYLFELNDKVWYGRDMDNNLYVGKFGYKMVFISTDGQEIPIQGYSCSIVCGKSAEIFYDRKDCFFPAQGYGGKLDRMVPSFESECFNH